MSTPSKQIRSPRHFNGIGLIIAMLREVDPIFRAALFQKLTSISPIIARLSEHTSFIYRDIPRLDDRGIQSIFSTIPEQDWLVAWKLSDETTKKFLLSNMSERRREVFLLAASQQPKILKRRVYAVQAQIGRKIHLLLRQGKLGLRSRRSP